MQGGVGAAMRDFGLMTRPAKRRLASAAVVICFIAGVGLAAAQALAATTNPQPPTAAITSQAPTARERPPRPTPPTRDADTPGYVAAKELPDGAVPAATADGNFIIGPTHDPAPEMTAHDGVPQGTVYEFTMSSADSKIYPGIARDPGPIGTVDPTDPAKLVVTTSHPAPYTRRMAVYVPKQYVPGAVVPFIVGADGPDRLLFTALDNLIAEGRVPVMIAISIGNGSGDAQGSERGLEYDTMSGLYAEFVETEVLPLVEAKFHVKLTDDPNGRATMGGSSGGSCALSMTWYHPELLSPRADLLRHLCESTVALQSADAAWRVGVSRAPDSGQSAQTAAHLDGGGRSRSAQSRCAARRHA